MPHFTRSSPTFPKRVGYRSYRQLVRQDFVQTCAYCLMTEIFAGGTENFELDHFRPRSQFPQLLNEFQNIYYACHPCNHAKSDKWPSAELEELGYSFVDFCVDVFATHFEASASGHWRGITESGKYTLDALRLNRSHLVEIRESLHRLGYAPQEGLPVEALRALLD